MDSSFQLTEHPELDQLIKMRSIPLFKIFTKNEDLLRLAEVGNWLKIPSGTIVIHEGALDDTMYVLIQGKAEVISKGKTLETLTSGDLFGEMGALLNEPRSAKVVTKTDCFIFEFSEVNLRSLSPHTVFLIMRYIFQLTANRLVATNLKLAAV